MYKLKIFINSLIVSFILLGLYLGVDHFNVYMKETPYKVTVTELYSGTSTGKHSHLEFIAVYKTDSGTYFDRRISASSYSRLSVGDSTVLILRPFDISQTPTDNILWFFIAKVLFGAIVFTSFIAAVISPFFIEE